MGQIKRVDVDNYFAAKRALRLGRTGPLSQPVAIGTRPAGKAKNAVPSIGNRAPRRSSPSLPAIVIPIVPGSRVTQGRTLLRSWPE